MTLHICAEPMREVHREADGEPRWCFTCRKRRDFVYVVDTPTSKYSYYGPHPSIQCASCGQVDGDIFPGRGNRVWEG